MLGWISLCWLIYIGLGTPCGYGQAQPNLDSLYCKLQTRLEISCNLQATKQSQAALDTLAPLMHAFDGRDEAPFQRLLGEFHFWNGYSGFYIHDEANAKQELHLADSIIFAIDRPGSELRARIRRLQGTVAYFMDENAYKAQNYYSEAYQEWLQIEGKDSVEYAVVLQCMGQAAGRLGEYDKSVDLYEQSLQIRELYYGVDHWRVGWTYWNLGNTHFYSHQYEKARDAYEEALKILQKATPDDVGPIAKISGNLSMVYYWLGRYAASIQQYNQTIRLFQDSDLRNSIDLASSYSNLAIVLAKNNEFAKAEGALEAAARIYAANGMSTGLEYANHLFNQAMVETEEHGTATLTYATLQKAMSVIAPGTHLDELFSYPSSNETDEPLMLQTIALFKANSFAREARASQNRKALLEASFAGYELAADLSDRLRMQYEDQDDKLFLSNHNTIYLRDALTVAHELWTMTGDRGYILRAFRFMERSKFQLLLEFFRKSQMQVAGELEEGSLRCLDSLRTGCNELDFVLSDPQLPVDSQRIYRAELLEMRQHLHIMEDSLKQKSRLFKAAYSKQTTVSLDSLAHAVRDTQLAAISYALTDSALFVVRVHAKATTFRLTPLPPHFADSVQAWVRLCSRMETSSASIQKFKRLGHQLFQVLLKPETEALPANVTKLLIVPDGILSSLPFEALLLEAPSAQAENYAALPYAIKKYQIHYGASASLWVGQRAIQYDNRPMECLGIAWGEKPADTMLRLPRGLPPLKGTTAELAAISAIIQGRYLLEEGASEAAFKQFSPQFGILHLALHARATGDPEIMFPHSGSDDEDGILHFHELFKLHLKSRMAVLSACETAVGELKVGEGIQSMSSGFAAAGIPTLLVSLWEVDDKSGAMIMESFYGGIAAGLQVDDALRKAKLDYLEHAKGFEASPFYWSTFVPMGNMEPIALQKANGNYAWSIALASGLALCIFLIFSIYKRKRKTI